MTAPLRVIHGPAPTCHRVVILAYRDVDTLELTSVSEVFTQANVLGARYLVTFVAPTAGEVRTASGMRFGVDGLDAAALGAETLVVPGAAPWLPALGDWALIGAVRRLDALSTRTVGLGAGTLLLANTGALDGRHAVSHWALASYLAGSYPSVRVDDTAIYRRDNKYLTSSGGAAAIDVALALLEDDHGAELAVNVARRLSVFMARPGDHPQLSMRLRTAGTTRATLRPILDAVTTDPAAAHSVTTLAALIGVSGRHLARLFATDVGLTPKRYVNQIRLEAACVMLRNGSFPLDVIAQRCGIGTSESLRRLFRQELGTTPSAYRSTHRLASDPDASMVRTNRFDRRRPAHPTALPFDQPHPEGAIHGCYC